MFENHCFLHEIIDFSPTTQILFFFARGDEPAGSPAAKPASCLAGLTSGRLATRPAVNTPRLAGWPPGRLWTPQRNVPAEKKKRFGVLAQICRSSLKKLGESKDYV